MSNMSGVPGYASKEKYVICKQGSEPPVWWTGTRWATDITEALVYSQEDRTDWEVEVPEFGEWEDADEMYETYLKRSSTSVP